MSYNFLFEHIAVQSPSQYYCIYTMKLAAMVHRGKILKSHLKSYVQIYPKYTGNKIVTNLLHKNRHPLILDLIARVSQAKAIVRTPGTVIMCQVKDFWI